MAYLIPKLKAVPWKKGSSELIGFALILPCIGVILFSVITIFQICLARQTLEHAVYMAGRAAVVCETQQAALNQAVMTARSTLMESTMAIASDDIHVALELVGGTSSAAGSGITWEKGALVKCTVSFPVNEILPLGNLATQEMSGCIYLMVERPARTYY